MRLIPRRSGRRTSTVAGGLRNACVAGLALVAFSAPPAFALSVFDIVQLSKQAYSDQAIIDLIDATGSAFELEAEDLPKLQELGVSEPVIRTMLERRAPEGWDSGEAVAADASHRAGEDPEDEPGSSHADVAGSKPHGHVRPAPAPQPDSPLTVQPFREAREGGHVHLALALDGLELFVLRDEGGYASIEARGQAIVVRLREAWAAGPGRFLAKHGESGAQVIFHASEKGTQPTIELLTISAGDADAYTLRSGRNVTPDLLALYWADLLSDYWAVAHGEPPGRLLAVHEGGALGVLHQALVNLDETNGTLRAAAERVPSSTLHHLERLARAVPMEYGPWREL